MSAETLRKAAEKLREQAKAATPGPWIASGRHLTTWAGHCTCCGIPPHEPGCGLDDPHAEAQGDDPAYIATLHPDVGLALADLLDMLAGDHEAADVDGGTWDHGVMPVARLILGGDA